MSPRSPLADLAPVLALSLLVACSESPGSGPDTNLGGSEGVFGGDASVDGDPNSNGGGSDWERPDGGADAPSPTRCALPEGTYSWNPANGSVSSNSNFDCSPPEATVAAWEHVPTAVTSEVDGEVCTRHADAYSDDGCEFTSLLSCTDGSSLRVECSFDTNASEFECVSYTDFVAVVCTTDIHVTRTGCPAPLVWDDGICHSPCPRGQQWRGTQCEDVDECLSAPCGEHGTCNNTVGSYSCSCDPGYGGASECKLVDACLAQGDTCSSEARCDEQGTAAKCVCREGYVGSGIECADVDECADGACGDHATCTNIPGSYSCQCDAGYNWNGTQCEPRDACIAAGFTCHADAQCDEALALCVCNPGLEGDGTECEDVDECSETPDLCGPNSICENNRGSYACDCEPGYVRSTGGVCELSDYCLVLGDCSEDASCLNTYDDDFVCQCDVASPSTSCGVWADTEVENAGFDRAKVVGFWFIAPFDMQIVAGRVPNQIGGFNGPKSITFYKLNTVGELSGDFSILGGGRTLDAQPVSVDLSVSKGDRIGVIGTGDAESPTTLRRSLPSDVGGVYISNFDGTRVQLKPLEARYTGLRFEGLYAWDDEPTRPSRGVCEFMWRRP